ncbi:hypothetical protein DFH09DRAFT_1211098, partial [Mycena vulgaris]
MYKPSTKKARPNRKIRFRTPITPPPSPAQKSKALQKERYRYMKQCAICGKLNSRKSSDEPIASVICKGCTTSQAGAPLDLTIAAPARIAVPLSVKGTQFDERAAPLLHVVHTIVDVMHFKSAGAPAQLEEILRILGPALYQAHVALELVVRN